MRRVLVILDDCPEIARGLRRFLKRSFDAVHVASTPAEAEEHLANPTDPPTYLLCDYYLGNGVPVGTELVRRWRRQFPTLARAAVVSGSEIQDLQAVEGVDKIFLKPVDATDVERFFTL